MNKLTKAFYSVFIILMLSGLFQTIHAQVFREQTPKLPPIKTKKETTANKTGGNTVLAGGCNNIDFESGDFTNWTGFEGYNENTTQPLTQAGGTLSPPPTNLNNAETSCQYFAIIANGSVDPNMGITLTSPLGGNCARMGGENRNLGDANTTCNGNGGGTSTYTVPTQCEATYFSQPGQPVNIGDQILLAGSAGEVLQTTFVVTPQNTAFQYAYLFAYTDNGSHDTTQQPYFKVRVLDQNGQEINCLNYFQQGLGDACGNTHAPPGYSGSLATGLFYTSQWQVSSLNLLPYLNQSVTVIFTVAGCTVGGHFGYAYVDCSCAPQQIIIPYTACQGGNTQLIAPPLGNAVFQWTTPNGNIVSGANTTTVTVNQSGTYSVTITPTKTSVDINGNLVTQTLTACSYELDTTITLYPNPTVSVNSATICTGTTGTLNVTSTGSAAPLTFTWSSTAGLTFTSGDTIATANPPSTTTYTITGTSAHGCKDTAVAHVTVNVEPPPTFTAPAVCLGTATTFSNTVTAGDTYQWNFGDTHTLADTAHIANPSYTYTYTGNFAVNFSVTTAGGCKSNVTQTVTVNPMPTLGFSLTPVCDQTPVCINNTSANQGSFSTWNWDFGDNSPANTTATPGCHTYAAAGIYTVVLTATTTSGCSGTVTATATVHPNPVFNGSFTEPCLGDPTTVYDASTLTNPAGLNDAITNWNWTFGDGGTATTTVDSVKHTYATCGGFNLSYTVSTNFNCTASGSATDSVFCIPHVTAPPSFSICPGMATAPQTFTSTVGNGGPAHTIWYTNYPVTNTGMTIVDTLGFDVFPSYNTIPKNMSCNPVSDMLYGVAVSNYCIGNTDSLKITVYPTPYLSHMPTDSICANQSLTVANFTACPVNSTIAWTNSNPSIGLAASGNGNIGSFNGTNTTNALNTAQISAVPTANGCVGNDSTFTIVVKPLPTMTVSSYTACPHDPIPMATITTNPAAGVNYTWANNNPSIGLPLSGTGAQPAYTAPTNTTLVNVTGLLTYTPTLNGCKGTPTTETIVIKPTPIVDPVPPSSYCPNEPTNPVVFTCQPTGGTPVFTYTVPGGIGLSQTGNLGSFTTINPGTTNITTTFTVNATLNGCQGPNSTFNITVYPNPKASFVYKPLVCEGSPMVFTDESVAYGGFSINSWQWDMNYDGNIDSYVSNPQYLYPTTGLDSVKLYVGTSSVPSCTAQVTEPVFVNPKPVADFIGVNLQGCPHPTLQTAFTDKSTPIGQIVTWNWNFGNGNTSNSQYPQPQNYTNASNLLPAYYTTSLIVKTDSGCVDSKTRTNYIEVYPTPVADFSWGPGDADIDAPTIHFVNEAIGASEYLPTQTYGQYGVEYYLGDTYASGTASNYVHNNTVFSHSYNDPDPNDVTETYYVTQWVINSYGCTDSITKPVEILPIFTFYIPNAFTPNGDKKNEGFKGLGIGIDNTTYNLWVFDRWGLMIYHATDIDKPWDGHMLGHEDKPVLQEDVYVWKVKFNDIFGKLHEYHGTVTLLK